MFEECLEAAEHEFFGTVHGMGTAALALALAHVGITAFRVLTTDDAEAWIVKGCVTALESLYDPFFGNGGV
jgi:hypothetical protein